MDRKSGRLTDLRFSDILNIIPSGDFLVLNDTKVFPARLLARKKQTHGRVDVLLLSPSGQEAGRWRCLIDPPLRENQEIEFEKGENAAAVCRGRDADGTPLLEFTGVADVAAFAEHHGLVPLPPYVKRLPEESDKERYQTVYADRSGAVAAPTAGLHFTPELLEKMHAKGVAVERVTLHVGYGTFKPVADLENHRMHAESFELREAAAEGLNAAKKAGKGIWAVGTTSLRVLETCVQNKSLIPGRGETDLFIKPPFEFEAVDHLLTNFHLPKTTLLLLVSAFMGEALRKKAYEHAIREKYRFYSYGDAMLIV